MRKVIGTILALFLMTGIGYGATYDVGFSWDPNSESDLAGYLLYQSNASGSYVFQKDGGTPVADIPAGTETVNIDVIHPDDTEATYYFVLTAYDQSNNESDASNEVSYRVDEVAPSPPGNFVIEFFRKLIAAIMNFFGGGSLSLT